MKTMPQLTTETLRFSLTDIATPSFVIDEYQLKKNLELIQEVRNQTNCKILLALKAFSSFSVFDLMRPYLDGCTSSSLHEAKLAKESFKKDVHIYSPAFKDTEFDEIASYSNHIVFNSPSQLSHFSEKLGDHPHMEVGVRLNPEFSQTKTPLHDPCIPGSRFGITKENLDRVDWSKIDGVLIHALSGLYVDHFENLLAISEKKFGHLFSKLKWVNFGGGHMICASNYDRARLCTLINAFKAKYGVQVILEPGHGMVVNTGYLVTSVIDIVSNGCEIAILDCAASTHMPDILEIPLRADIVNAELPGVLPYTYRLGSNTCLSGDILGDYSFANPLKPGDKIAFCDMAAYTIVKSSTFNGVQHPDIAIWRLNNTLEIVRRFGYEEFKNRLS